jgi:hypothetical protein
MPPRCLQHRAPLRRETSAPPDSRGRLSLHESLYHVQLLYYLPFRDLFFPIHKKKPHPCRANRDKDGENLLHKPESAVRRENYCG